MTIKLSDEKWGELCDRIDNEGLAYYVMYYTDAESFGEMVNGDAEAIKLFKEASNAMIAFSNYLRLEDY